MKIVILTLWLLRKGKELMEINDPPSAQHVGSAGPRKLLALWSLQSAVTQVSCRPAPHLQVGGGVPLQLLRCHQSSRDGAGSG